MNSFTESLSLSTLFLVLWHAGLVLFAPSGKLRERHRQHERAAVEHVLDPRLDTQEGQPGDPRDEEVDGDERSPGVEPARDDAGRAEKRRRERGQQEPG